MWIEATGDFTNLPQVLGVDLDGQAITTSNEYIGASGFDASNNFRVVTYKRANGAYGIYRDSYPTSGGFDTFSMKFVENPTGVFVLASYYDDSFVQKAAMFTIDGDEVVADVGDGYVTGAVSVGGNIYVQTDGGTVTAISPTYETRRYAVGQLFGSTSFSFDRGSLFVSPTGDLGVVAKNGPKTVVKTFEVPQDATLPQVDGSSIVVPEIVAGGAGTISWAPVAGATGYDLAFSQNGVVARTASVTTASYAVPASFRAGSYTLTIRAAAGERLGPLSSEVAVVVKPQAVVRTTLTGLPVLANSASVIRWQAVPDASSYEVVVSSLSQPPSSSQSLTVTGPIVTLTDGVEAGTWRFAVRAVTGEIAGEWTEVDFTVVPRPFLAPVMVPVPMPITDSTPTFAWSAPEGAVGYNLWLTNRDARTRVLYQTGLTGTSFEVPTPIDPARYAVWVQAVNASGQTSAWSTLTEFDLLAPAVVLTSGGGQSFDGRPRLVWSTVSNATSYEIRITPVGSATSEVSVTGVTGTTFTPTSPIPAGRYVISLRAFRGTRVFSVWNSGDSLLVRSGPTGLLRIGSDVSGSAGFRWQSVPGAVSYFY